MTTTIRRLGLFVIVLTLGFVVVLAVGLYGMSASSSVHSSATAVASVQPRFAADRRPGAGRIAVARLERALRAAPNAGVTAASCRRETTAEVRRAPFGATRRPVFLCVLTVRDDRARYDTQVLSGGCFVAERRPPGRAVYGCGAGRS